MVNAPYVSSLCSCLCSLTHFIPAILHMCPFSPPVNGSSVRERTCGPRSTLYLHLSHVWNHKERHWDGVFEQTHLYISLLTVSSAWWDVGLLLKVLERGPDSKSTPVLGISLGLVSFPLEWGTGLSSFSTFPLPGPPRMVSTLWGYRNAI